jgi:hypothetical protein
LVKSALFLYYVLGIKSFFWVMGVILGEISLPEESMIADAHMLWFEAENLCSSDEKLVRIFISVLAILLMLKKT